jgi:hypothetical protein
MRTIWRTTSESCLDARPNHKTSLSLLPHRTSNSRTTGLSHQLTCKSHPLEYTTARSSSTRSQQEAKVGVAVGHRRSPLWPIASNSTTLWARLKTGPTNSFDSSILYYAHQSWQLCVKYTVNSKRADDPLRGMLRITSQTLHMQTFLHINAFLLQSASGKLHSFLFWLPQTPEKPKVYAESGSHRTYIRRSPH